MVNEKTIEGLVASIEAQLSLGSQQALVQERDLSYHEKNATPESRVVVKNYKDATRYLIKNWENFIELLKIWMVREVGNETSEKFFPRLTQVIPKIEEDIKAKEEFILKVDGALEMMGTSGH